MTDSIFPRRGRTSLLVVDVQERLLPAMCVPPDTLCRAVTTLASVAETFDWPVFWTEQYPRGLGTTPDAVANALRDLGATPFEKTAFSALKEPGYDDAIGAGIRDHVVVCGIETHVCVLQTVADLQGRGHQCFVPYDAVASRTEANRDFGLQALREAGAVVSSVETLLFYALERAGTPEFKRLAPLIR